MLLFIVFYVFIEAPSVDGALIGGIIGSLVGVFCGVGMTIAVVLYMKRRKQGRPYNSTQ